MHVLRSVMVWLMVGLALCGLSFACAPTAAPPTPAPTVDAFAVVRATSQAAYASGKAHLDRGEFLPACVDLDTARTTDPDNRAEIQQALAAALQNCLTPPPEPTPAAPSAAARTIVVATVPSATPPSGSGTAAKPVAASATPSAAGSGAAASSGGATPPASGGTTSAASNGASGGATAATAGGGGTPAAPAGVIPTGGAAAANLVTWNDPQGRFTVGTPTDWIKADQPQSFFGTGVVAFHDPSARAEVDVAVDSNTKAVSPELYAASLELAMQQQVPGYASEQVVPGTAAGNPSIRRVFTFTQRDAAGHDHQARGFQVAIVKGATPYVISGSAPADQFQQYNPTFDRIVQSFRFS